MLATLARRSRIFLVANSRFSPANRPRATRSSSNRPLPAAFLLLLVIPAALPIAASAHPGHPGHAQAEHRHGDDFPDGDRTASRRQDGGGQESDSDSPKSVWLYRPGRREAVAAVVFFVVAIYFRRARDRRGEKWLRFSGSFRMAVVYPEPQAPGLAQPGAPRRAAHRVKYFEVSSSNDPLALDHHRSESVGAGRSPETDDDRPAANPVAPRIRYLLAIAISCVALSTAWGLVRRPDGADGQALAVDRLATIGCCGFVGAATLAACLSCWWAGRRRRDNGPSNARELVPFRGEANGEPAGADRIAPLPRTVVFPDSIVVALLSLLLVCTGVLVVELCRARLPSLQASNFLGLAGLGAIAGAGLAPWVLARQQPFASKPDNATAAEHTLIAADGREVDIDEPAFTPPINWTGVVANHLLLMASLAGFAAALAADRNSALVAAAALLIFTSVSAAESRYAARRGSNGADGGRRSN